MFFGLFVFFSLFFWRVSGSGEMARRATSLGPKPSWFVCFCLFWFLVVFCFVSSFLCLLLVERTFLHPQKGIFVNFWVSPFVSPEPCLASHLFKFSFSISLSLSLSCSFLSFFRPSCLYFLLSFGAFFLSLLCFFFLSSLLLINER